MNIYILERIARRNHSEMFNGFVIVADTYIGLTRSALALISRRAKNSSQWPSGLRCSPSMRPSNEQRTD